MGPNTKGERAAEGRETHTEEMRAGEQDIESRDTEKKAERKSRGDKGERQATQSKASDNAPVDPKGDFCIA